MLKIYTSQFRYNGKNRLDITIKTGNKVFAPTWDLVTNYKNGNISEEEYTKKYYQLMRKSYKENREVWEKLLTDKEVVLVCYCPENNFCHRYLLKDILVKCGAKYLGEIR